MRCEWRAFLFPLLCMYMDNISFAQAGYWNDPGDSTLVLEAGGSIRPFDAAVVSPSGKYKVRVEYNALVVYRQSISSKRRLPSIVWSTQADGHTVQRLELTHRGNLFLWGRMEQRNGAKLWKSNTPLARTGLYEPVLSLTDDGYLQLSIDGEVYWESAGLRETACLNNATLSNKSAEVIRVGQTITRLKKYYSPSKNFYLILQIDGNMAVYRDCDSTPTWSSYTYAATPYNITLTRSGEFVYYGDMGFWNSLQMWFKEPQFNYTEAGRPNSELRLADNGRLYLCQKNDCYWQSGYQDPDVDDLTHHIKVQAQKQKGIQKNEEGKETPVAARVTSSTARAAQFGWLSLVPLAFLS